MTNTTVDETENPRAVIGGNQPPDPFITIKQEIDDLFDEAKNFCDGEPISTPEMADAITKLHDDLHEAGKRAEEMRVAEKKPLDEAVAAVQAKWNPLVQPKKGRVALGKDACASLLTPWRTKLAREKEEAARKAREEAAEAARVAQEAMQASRGNLEARVDAEELAAHAKDVERGAKRAERQATTGLGLRTTWVATLIDAGAGLDWAYDKSPERFTELVQQIANEAVRAGIRTVPGFEVTEQKAAW